MEHVINGAAVVRSSSFADGSPRYVPATGRALESLIVAVLCDPEIVSTPTVSAVVFNLDRMRTPDGGSLAASETAVRRVIEASSDLTVVPADDTCEYDRVRLTDGGFRKARRMRRTA